MTRTEWATRLAARAAEAERLGSMAPIANVLRVVLLELADVDGLPTTTPPPDQLLTLEEAAARLQVTTRWLRETRHPYVVEIGPKTLRVSERLLAKWLANAPSGA